MTEQRYLLANIRDLLLNGFDDQELRRLCYYVPDFRSVYDELARTTGKADIVDNLIEYADTHLLIDTLLELARERNPARYAHHGPYYRAERVAAQGKLDAIFYSEAKNVHRPEKLFGRDNLLNKVHELLDNHKQVLLCGLAGTGKTALAATAADQRITEGKGPVIWLQTGHENAEAIFDALVQHFATVEERLEISRLAVDAKIVAVGDLLGRSEASLLVLDNVWNGHALFYVLKAIPDGMSVLVTSRQKFALDEIVEVGDLSPLAALDLLGYHAGQKEYGTNVEAQRLCAELGHHAYALEIAGTTLKVDELTPGELCEQVTGVPHDMPMPEDLAAEGRESVKRLLDGSFYALDAETQAVFGAFGAFFAPGVTSALMAAYMQEEKSAMGKVLKKLVRRSLAKRLAGTDYYFLHDLTFSYARTMFEDGGEDHQEMVAAVQRYVVEYAQDFDRLALDQNNILEAARVAQAENVEALISILTILATGGYLDVRGHTLALLNRLDKTIEAVRQKGAKEHETLHYLLGKRGNAHFDRGELEEAYQAYQAALDLAPNAHRQVILLGVMGKVRSEQELYTEADACFQQGRELAEANDDDLALRLLLEQQCFAAGRKGDFEAARWCAAEAIEVQKRIKPEDPVRLARAMLNLGSAEFHTGLHKALSAYQQVYKVAQEEGVRPLMAHALCGLGYVYHVLDKGKHYDRAQECLEQGRKLWRDMGRTTKQTEVTEFMVKFGYLKQE